MMSGQLEFASDADALTEAREHCAAAAERTGLPQLLLRASLIGVVVERIGKDASNTLLSVDQAVLLMDEHAGSVGIVLVGQLPEPIRRKLALIVATAETPPAGAA